MVNRKELRNPAEIARIRIDKLQRIVLSHPDDPELQRNCTKMMKLLSQRVNMTLPQYIKRGFCSNCGTPYGRTTLIRVRRNIVHVRCGFCGELRRLPYGITRSESQSGTLP
jgi:RNase P subunit RPR2